jgi:hypothetical protein
MKTEIMKTRSGRILKIRSNKSERTYTIQTETAKYKTVKMTQDEFDSCWYNTANDWADYLKSPDYYKIK